MSGTTKDDDVRWTYLASGVTILLYITFCVLLIGASLGFLSLGAIPQAWYLLYATLLSASAVWLWGEDVWRVVKDGD